MSHEHSTRNEKLCVPGTNKDKVHIYMDVLNLDIGLYKLIYPGKDTITKHSFPEAPNEEETGNQQWQDTTTLLQ